MEFGEGDFIIYESEIGKLMFCVCIYEPVTVGLITVTVEHVELVPVTTGNGGWTQYLEGEIGNPSSKDVAIVMVLLFRWNLAFYYH